MGDIIFRDMSTRIGTEAIDNLLTINVEWEKGFCVLIYDYPSRKSMQT